MRRQQKIALRVLSLGGGTQSTALALLAKNGELDVQPDVAIFADTGWEPKSVYENIDWLKSVLSFPIITVGTGTSIREDIVHGINAQGNPWLTIPAFMTKPDGTQAGMNWRQCTSNYKIAPIHAKVRELLGMNPRSPVPPGTQIEMWLGITTDETERMRISPDPWIINKYPLVDKGLSRENCLAWFNEKYPNRHLPRSACIGCPYHSRKSWMEMYEKTPEEFEDAEKVDTLLRDADGRIAGLFRNRLYLHSSRKPLREAVLLDISTANADGEEGWGNECAGMCGV